MCGIFCELSFTGSGKYNMNKNMLYRIQNRGPDCINSSHIVLPNNIHIFFHGAVLWMQGLIPFRQPAENNTGILLFNGDIFDDMWDNDTSDTEVLMEKLSDAGSSEKQILQVLQSLKGPFSIIYFDKLGKNLYFSRDRIGRTSLLCFVNELSFVMASVLDRKHKCIEVPATHIYKLNIESHTLNVYSWNSLISMEEYNIQDWIEIVENKQNVPDDDFTFEHDFNLDTTNEEDVISHIQGTSLQHGCKLSIMRGILENNTILRTVQKITELLENSVRLRLRKHPQKCKNCIHNSPLCNHSAVGVLFSGGLDCTILAFLAHKFVPKNQPIDLINVAFKMNDNASYEVPDRTTGRQSLNELKEICKTREWVFKEINVPKEKLEKYQASTIADLVYPRHTVLDESLGSALWFAALGEDDNNIPSCSRVLLLGSGADELFGGYVRHRNAFKRYGWGGLSKELMLDWKRISFRNLARDNRVICDHGRQPRMPYLDEELTNYVLKLNPWLKCFPSESLPCGIGDKLILRLVALNVGLLKVAELPKRALQFGSKIANKKEKGSDVSKSFIFSPREKK